MIFARSLTGVLDGAPKVGEFPTGELQEYPVGCWLGTMNGWIMTNKVRLAYSSTAVERGVDGVGLESTQSIGADESEYREERGRR